MECSGAGVERQAARSRRAQIEATVELIPGLSELAMSVLGEIEGVIRTPQGALEVAQIRVDRLELRQLRVCLASAGDNTLVVDADEGGSPTDCGGLRAA